MHVQQATSGRSVKRISARSFNNHCVNSFDLRLVTNNAETKEPEEYLSPSLSPNLSIWHLD